MTELQTRDSVQARPWRMPFFWPIAIGAFSAAWAAMYLPSLAMLPMSFSTLGGICPDSFICTTVAQSLAILAMIIGGVLLVRRGHRLPLQLAAMAAVCLDVARAFIVHSQQWASFDRNPRMLVFATMALLVIILCPLLISLGLYLGVIRRDADTWRESILRGQGRAAKAWPIAIAAIAIGMAAFAVLESLPSIALSLGVFSKSSAPHIVSMFSIDSLVHMAASLMLMACGYCLLRFRRSLPLRLYPVIAGATVAWDAIGGFWPAIEPNGRSLAYTIIFVHTGEPLLLAVLLAILTFVARPGRQVRAWRKNATDDSAAAPTPLPQDVQS